MSVLVHLFAVLPPVGHVLPPPQVLLAAKSAAGWTPLWLGEKHEYLLYFPRGEIRIVSTVKRDWLGWTSADSAGAAVWMQTLEWSHFIWICQALFFWETIAKRICVTANSSILLTWTFHFVLLHYIMLVIFFSLVKSCTSVLPTSNTKHFNQSWLFVDSISMD